MNIPYAIHYDEVWKKYYSQAKTFFLANLEGSMHTQHKVNATQRGLDALYDRTIEASGYKNMPRIWIHTDTRSQYEHIYSLCVDPRGYR